MIDFNFIKQLEGFELKGYVPDPKNSKSGVTIASGFDLGHRSPQELSNAFEANLADRLTPYTGMVKQQALDFLNDNPLTVTEEEANTINEFAHESAVNKLTNEWNDSCDDPFDSIASPCQTVVASVAFQYGSLSRKTPNFWKQVTSLDWPAALNNLRHFGDKYASRRNKEADVLESYLNG